MSDPIDRQAAIDVLSLGKEILRRVLDDTDVVGTDRDKYSWGLGLIVSYIKDIKELPPVQHAFTDEQVQKMQDMHQAEIEKAFELGKEDAKPQWIPVTERLPEDGTWNIFSDGKNISVERYKMDAIEHFFPQGRWFSFDEAIAWMPLPEPYKEEGEQDGQTEAVSVLWL